MCESPLDNICSDSGVSYSRQMPELNFRKSGLGLPSLPRDFATTHKEEFAWPPAGGASEPERGTTERISAFKVGEGGPMAEQSSHMLDYKDPHVGRTMPERPPKGIFRRPVCRFETQSETGASYPRWKDLPGQPAADLHKDNIRVEPAEHDARYLVSTYQEDYDGLPAALCPARMAENYGRRALEPKHRFACSANDHDYYQKGEDLAEKRD
ncbi:uncharacterized protein CDAR_86801 [Caerostris darwini]|uniref:Uncharacterized protein n=1 Tax=Caerostris darwini TaxID=1538125 RepID=A0AAV4VMS6_9ARAC|nr:uncharacterized protein CDAR_86801 [Caerostris darwini]